MEINELRTARLFFVVLGLLVCTFVKTDAKDRTRFQYNSDRQEVTIRPPSTKIERLPANIFPPELTDILSPEMFSQPDPVYYLLEKIVEKPLKEVQNMQHYLKPLTMYDKEKFPPGYLPYATVLWNLLNCRCNLEGVKNVIDELRSSSGLPYPSPPAGLFTPELKELFTSDIFSDNKPPFRLIIKLANIPINKPDSIKREVRKMYFGGRFPERYKKYSEQLWLFLMDVSNLKWLVHSIFALKNSFPFEFPNPNSKSFAW